jgi:hypothetical protein
MNNLPMMKAVSVAELKLKTRPYLFHFQNKAALIPFPDIIVNV